MEIRGQRRELAQSLHELQLTEQIRRKQCYPLLCVREEDREEVQTLERCQQEYRMRVEVQAEVQILETELLASELQESRSQLVVSSGVSMEERSTSVLH